MYRSAPYLAEFHRRAAAAVAPFYSDVEFIYVNDGSPDESLTVALAMQRTDPRIRIVDLSRNFGHHYAIFEGLAHARGEDVFLLDCDLEEPPEAFADLLEERQRQQADVAFGVQRKRKGGAFERLSGSLYYAVVNLLWRGQRIPDNLCLIRVMSRRYVDALLCFDEAELIFSGVAEATGFKQAPVPVAKTSKRTSTYSLRAKIRLLVRTVTAWSDRPLIIIAYAGFAIFSVASVVVAYDFIVYVVRRTVPPGFTSLMISIWFLGGMILFALGIIAVYLSVIFVEVKRRPRSIVRALYEPSPFSLGLDDIDALPPEHSTPRAT